MTAEEKKLTLSQNLSAALNPVKIDNPTNVDPVTRQEVQKKSLAEIIEDFKDGERLKEAGKYLFATGVLKMGFALIAAKEKAQHGEWLDWLKNHFHLGEKSAQNYMRVAERFGGNPKSISDLNYTQMTSMLALPEGEEEKFIEAKAAEGTPVEEMTVKNLKAEIADWKAKTAQAETEKAQAEQDRDQYKTSLVLAEAQRDSISEQYMTLKETQAEESVRAGKLLEENANLQEQIEELQDKYDETQNELLREKNNVKTTTVEVAPADYEPMKKELSEIKVEYDKLQAELKEFQNRPIEVAVEKPADYEAVKAKLAELEKRQKTLQADFAVMADIQKGVAIAQSILNCVNLQQIVSTMMKKNPNFEFGILQLFEAVREIQVCIDLNKKGQADKKSNRLEIQKSTFQTFQSWFEKISNGQRDFISVAQNKAVEIFGVKIPENVFNADDSRKAFAVWLGREINPIVVDGDYKEEIRVVGDSYDWSAVKQ